MTKWYLEILWFIVSLVPAAFLFHFFEYVQQVKATYLLVFSILFIVIAGLLAIFIKTRYFILLNVLTIILSMILAFYFIPNDGSWFKPFELNSVIILTAIVFFGAQSLVRLLMKKILKQTG